MQGPRAVVAIAAVIVVKALARRYGHERLFGWLAATLYGVYQPPRVNQLTARDLLLRRGRVLAIAVPLGLATAWLLERYPAHPVAQTLDTWLSDRAASRPPGA